jgi:hypothetical protein
LFSAGAKAAYAYDPRTGRELWRVRYDAWSAAPLPLYDHGLAFIITGFGGKTELLAVRADGKGDITDTHVAWRSESMVAKTASPILVQGLLYMVNDEGSLTCLERPPANGFGAPASRAPMRPRRSSLMDGSTSAINREKPPSSNPAGVSNRWPPTPWPPVSWPHRPRTGTLFS